MSGMRQGGRQGYQTRQPLQVPLPDPPLAPRLSHVPAVALLCTDEFLWICKGHCQILRGFGSNS